MKFMIFLSFYCVGSPAPSPTKSIPSYNNDSSAEVVSSPVTNNHEDEPVKKKVRYLKNVRLEKNCCVSGK